jgi:hypothetical protein
MGYKSDVKRRLVSRRVNEKMGKIGNRINASPNPCLSEQSVVNAKKAAIIFC